jgi:lipopolysaccharide transport system ATP-binding protein
MISVENVSKVYRVGSRRERADSIVGSVQQLVSAPFKNWRALRHVGHSSSRDGTDLHWALRDVSFDVVEGSAVGIIGRNGAGKSTLLKILSRITEPSEGRVRLRGRVSSLLEVGTGFHPDLSGRENVYLNGTILGLTKREIDARFDQIVEFSDVSKFLETPVKRYSSGMRVRLAFAVAAHLDPEILIIDEVLAVGDAQFQKRCVDRMLEIASAGKTILFVSHSLDLIERLCSKAVVLQQGQVQYQGDVRQAIATYLGDRRSGSQAIDLTDFPRRGNGDARFSSIEFRNSSDAPVLLHPSGDTLRICLEIECRQDLEDIGVSIVLKTLSGTRAITAWNREFDQPFAMSQGRWQCTCEFEQFSLRAGHELWVSIWMESKGVMLDALEAVTEIRAVLPNNQANTLSTNSGMGFMVIQNTWDLKRSPNQS